MASPPCLLCHETSADLEYYKFPVTREMRAAWTAAIGAVVETICSSHFSEDDYCLLRGRRRLRASAVPSKLLEQKSPPASIVDENESSNEKKEEIPESKNDTENIQTIDTRCRNTKNNQNKKSKRNTIKNKEKDVVKESKPDAKKDEICVKENGTVSAESAPNEETDIEAMITNYQIKQTKTLADRLNPEPLEDLIPAVLASQSSQSSQSNEPTDKLALPLDSQAVAQLANRLDSQLDSKLASQASRLDETSGDLVVEIEPEVVVDSEPVFIEVSVDKEPGSRAASPEDCLMLLESVQCEVDPSSLMLPEHGPETDSDMEIVDTKKEDPISLLTSSDEDEVIIQEPHIDTVDVSDETDEDDRPLTRFVKEKPQPKKPAWYDGLTNIIMPKLQYQWGVYQYCCEQCNFRTQNDIEFKQHMIEFEHPSISVQVCQTCNYSTGSKAQFARHRRKHKDERNYKCNLCNYKARHKMSLMYHLKSHQPRGERNPAFVCDKCGFSSNAKSEGLNHIKTCNDGGALRCDQCNYTTKRRSDFKRHRMRKHSIDDTDADFTV